MKNLTKMKAVQKVAIIATIAVIGFSMIACDLNNDDPPSFSLNGIWAFGTNANGDPKITINGSTAIWSTLGNPSGYTLDAINKGYYTLGGETLRNLTSTGNLTWSGQILHITWNNSNPNVATGTQWANCTITMSENGQTINVTSSSTTTLTRSSYSLNGVWELNDGAQVAVSGNNGTWSTFGSPNAVTQDAITKGYYTIGGETFRNLASTGNLTWSGQILHITWNNSSPNVATGTQWANCTITMGSNGQTIDITSTGTSTLIRRR